MTAIPFEPATPNRVDGRTEAELLAEFYPLIRREAALARRRCPWADPEDLHQRGALGLLSAIRSPARKTDRPLAPFAWASIRNAIRGSPEIERGVDRVLLGRVIAGHDSLLASGTNCPDPVQIAEEANRLSANSKHPHKAALMARDVERALAMLAFVSTSSIEKLCESGWELATGDGSSALPSSAWFDAFTDALDRMLDDCCLSENKVFVAKHLVFGWPLSRNPAVPGDPPTVPSSETVARVLSVSGENVRQLKVRARGAITARFGACLEDAGLVHANDCLWAILALLTSMEDEANLNLSALTTAPSVLVEARAVLSRRARDGSSPRWLADLVELFLAHVNQAERQ